MARPAVICVLIVVYRPRIDEFAACLRALQTARAAGVDLQLRLWHNDEGPAATAGLPELYGQLQAQGLPLEVDGAQGNLGFGRGINAMLPALAAPFALVLNQDAIPEPGALERLAAAAAADTPEVAAWEMRQIPYEHPKHYDPVSGDTEWCSGAAVLLRSAALRDLGGFESRIFMYCEDVDLSWRLRCAGWRLRYLPRCAVVHRTYSEPGEVKPLMLLGSVYANLCLRARYAGPGSVAQGLAQALNEWRAPQSFPGRRRGIALAIVRFALDYPYFRRTRCAGPGFAPRFAGWDYELRREGAFHAFLAAAERPAALPLVSVLVPAIAPRPPGWLRQALVAIDNQTHRPIEVVVVDDGAPDVGLVCAEFAGHMDLRRVGSDAVGGDRATAGVRALAVARGEWLALLGEGEIPYADHVEVLLQAALDASATGGQGLGWVIPAPSSGQKAAGLPPDGPPAAPAAAPTAVEQAPAWSGAVLVHRGLCERDGRVAAILAALDGKPGPASLALVDAGIVRVHKTTTLRRAPVRSGDGTDSAV